MLSKDKTSQTIKIEGIGYAYKAITQSQFGATLSSLARLGHTEAINILEATFEESLERRLDNAFNVKRTDSHSVKRKFYAI